MDNHLIEYDGNMQKLVSTLRTIVESDEYVIIQEKYQDENVQEELDKIWKMIKSCL